MEWRKKAGERSKPFLRRERRKGGFDLFRNTGKERVAVLFSEGDIAVLRLLCWCKYTKPDDLKGVVTETELGNLMRLGFIKLHEKSGAISLTKSGGDFLFEVTGGAIPKASHSYREALIQRRIHVSRVVLTAYRAGANVFTTTPEELSEPATLFLPSLTRNRGSNPWGSARVAALAHLGELMCAFHYVCPGIGRLALTDELTAFANQTARLPKVRRALVFAGESYQDILSELEWPGLETDAGLLSYGEAYRRVQLPVYLVSCDDIGAIQLKIMAVPDYRRRIAKAALKTQYQPPPEDVPAWDAFFQGMPFVVAVDMDLRRVEEALETAHMKGHSQIALAALEGQGEAVLFSRYRDEGKARVFALTKEALTEGLGISVNPGTLPRGPYFTKKGEVVNAPPIQAAGKIGKTVRKAGRHHRR